MFGKLGLVPRVVAVLALALVCPHPISFREGGYLPVAVILSILPDEPLGGLLMLGFCVLLYGLPLFVLSFVLLRHAARQPGETTGLSGWGASTEMITFLRWIAVPLAAIAVWYAVLLLGLAGVGALDALCPPELVVSGACTAPWHGPSVEALILVCTAVAAFGIVIVPALVAPSHRFRVALASFLGGAAFAVYAAGGGSVWIPFAVAAVTGSGALRLAASKWRGSPGASGDNEASTG